MTTTPRRAAGSRTAGSSTTQVHSRSIDRFARAHDASHYLLIPDAVLSPADAEGVARAFGAVRAAGRTMTFRSGGTSLSGQSVSGDILVDTRSNFRDIRVEDDGAMVRVGPGATVRQVNTTAHAVSPQARPRPGERDRLHDRRSRREQLQRHGVRYHRELVPDHRVDDDRAARAGRSSTRVARMRTRCCARQSPRSPTAFSICGHVCSPRPSTSRSSASSSR